MPNNENQSPFKTVRAIERWLEDRNNKRKLIPIILVASPIFLIFQIYLFKVAFDQTPYWIMAIGGLSTLIVILTVADLIDAINKLDDR